MEVTQQIAKALIALVAANEVEEQLRAAHPGIPLEPMSVPNTGKLGPAGGPAQIWFNYVRNRGYLNDDAEPEGHNADREAERTVAELHLVGTGIE